MIELLPPLPPPPGQTGQPGQTPVRADFGQWLSGSPGHPQDTPSPQPTPPSSGPVLPASLVPAALLEQPVPAPDAMGPPLGTIPGTELPLPAPAAPTPSAAVSIAAHDTGVMSWSLAATKVEGGVVELIASPWRLAAGEHLSQQVGAKLALVMSGPATAALAARAPADVGQGPGSSPTMSAAPMLPAIRVLEDAAIGPPPLAAHAARAAQALASDDGSAVRGALPGHAAQWPLRLLRWLNDGEGGKTAWLRDFTLDSAATATLVVAVRRFAQAENLPLARIVLNGQTIWSADSPLRDPT